MSQVSGAFTVELPTERIGREVAAEVVRLLDETGLVPALAAAVARELTGPAGPRPGEPGGYPVGGRHGGPGSQHYDREPEADR